MIVKRGKEWVVTSKHGRVLGHHKTRKSALAQLRAIEVSKHKRGK